MFQYKHECDIQMDKRMDRHHAIAYAARQ